jgi:phosphoribosyl 1,2-cyclic phosphate phosphodiesterase
MTAITFLGTGTSNGIPVIGCTCAVCRSLNPRDKRGRTSAFVRHRGLDILIDTSTELRIQALANGLDHIDAVLFTHAHADHTGGFDDLRRFNEMAQAHLPVYASPETASVLRERFAYAFEDAFPFYGGKPDLTLHEVTEPFAINGVGIEPLPVWHGKLKVYGYRFGSLAYITDAKEVPTETRERLLGLDVLVINALRDRPHPTHLSIQEAVEIIEDVKPREAWLVHLSHEIDHDSAQAMLPAGVSVAFDGHTVTTIDHPGT